MTAENTTPVFYDVTTESISDPVAMPGTGQSATVNGAPVDGATLTGTSGNDVLDGTVISPDMETTTTTTTTIETRKAWDTINPQQTIHHDECVSSTSTTADPVIAAGHEVAVDQTFIESSGTNTLTGGRGADTFVFHIDFAKELVEHDITYNGDAVPGQVSGANTNGVWNSFVSNLNEWRAAMAAEHGVDLDAGAQHQDFTYSSGKTIKSGAVDYDNVFTWGEEVVRTNDSANTITDFGNGGDKIELAGITLDQFNHYARFSDDGHSVTVGTFTITTADHVLSVSDFAFI